MPEIKNQFTGGKMNKDLDERLVPNGQYRDAMNIQVATSEGSDVGTAQNILGNLKISGGDSIKNPFNRVVGCIADEKNDTLYYLVWNPNGDYIFSLTKGKSARPILVDINKNVLKFEPTNAITGINVIDGMLFWTDNFNEPRKINIARCQAGTSSTAVQTKFINEPQGITVSSGIDIEEKHITVIKKGPQVAPKMKLRTSRALDKVYTAIISISSADTDPNGEESSFITYGNSSGWNDFSSASTEQTATDSTSANRFYVKIYTVLNAYGEEIDLPLIPTAPTNATPGLEALTGWYTDSTYGGSSPISWLNASKTKVVLQAYDEDGTPPGLPLTDFAIKGFVSSASSANGGLGITVTTIDGFPPQVLDGEDERKYVIDLFEDDEKLFEFKFPRFSYRYKYEDGEYSTFAPFTQVAFAPGAFDYHPRKGYNIGMTNKLQEVQLLDMVTQDTPSDVVAIDILFKDDASPSIYIVDTIRPDDYVEDAVPVQYNLWERMLRSSSDPTLTQEAFSIKREAINSIIPSNQLLRPWDNVPKKALAQDITGNRIVYANYFQNYDLLSQTGEKYVPNFIVSAITDDNDIANTLDNQNILNPSGNVASNAFKSVKSLREYQLGVVFLDEYGRETPVISNASGTTRFNKKDGDKVNKLGVQFSSDDHPQSITHFKFYVKETSSEYYNMAMDRWYSAGDGNIWLAFPSSDRNKVDIDTFLILKKGSDQDTLVKEAARYKVLAIESEAPDFIKTTKRKTFEKSHAETGAPKNKIFNLDDAPLEGRAEFKMNYKAFHGTSGQDLATTEEELYIEFGKIGTDQVSDRYKINSVTNSYIDPVNTFDDTDTLTVGLDEPLGADINFITNDANGINSSFIENGAIVKVYKYKAENLDKFDGRFFVKIYFDEVFRNNIETTTIGGSLRVLTSRKVYSMDSEMVAKHTEDLDRYLTRGYGEKRDVIQDDWFPQQWYWHSDSILSGASVYTTLSVLAGGPADTYGQMTYGYYAVDEFTANASYFRRYRQKKYTSYGEESTSSEPDYGVSQVGDSGVGGALTKAEIRSKLNNVINVRALVHLKQGGGSANTNFDDSDWVKYNDFYWKDADEWHKEFGYHTTKYSDYNRAVGMLSNDEWSIGVTTCWEPEKNGSYSSIGWSGWGYDYYSGGTLQYYNSNVTGGGSIGIRYKESEDGYKSDKDSARDTEVWFIDKGPYIGTTIDSAGTLRWTQIYSHANPTAPYGNGNIGKGLDPKTGYWNMELGYGGIHTNNTSNASSIDNFWNVGNWNEPTTGTNPGYDDPLTNTFVNSLNTGSQFKWKEDNNDQKYTIDANVTESGRTRHSDGPSLPSGVASGVWSSWRDLYDGFIKDDEDQRDTRSMAEGLSFNLTKKWDLKHISPSIGWNPTSSGVINGGLSLSLECVTDTGSSSFGQGGFTASGQKCSGVGAQDLRVYVRDITVLVNGKNETLHEGMALTSFEYDDGGIEVFELHDMLVVRRIQKQFPSLGTVYELTLGGYEKPMLQIDHNDLQGEDNSFGSAAGGLRNTSLKPPIQGGTLKFRQVGMNGYSPNSEFNINTISRFSSFNDFGAIGAVGYTLEFTEEIQPTEVLSENPAIWETEPKDTTELDIYYEACGSIPTKINDKTIASALPIGTKFLIGNAAYTVVGYNGDQATVYGASTSISTAIPPFEGIQFFRPDDLVVTTNITGVNNAPGANKYYILLEANLIDNEYILPWHNCYTFKNGVESNRIRDNFNLPFISNGVKASTTLEQEYKEEHRKYGLIYSGIYNSTSGINNLNQFIAAEKITKDVNPIYGSIQKLYSRDSDLVTLCEDKILKIVANKDALFNADGNPQLIATDRVLGQTIPFSGEFGISTDPESFASENYRAYFTDRVRGAVMRLSKDGLTPISDIGMRDYFRDNLKNATELIGSYDDRNNEYNVTSKHYPIINIIGVQKGAGLPYEAAGRIIVTSQVAALFTVGALFSLIGFPNGSTVGSKTNLGGGQGIQLIISLPSGTSIDVSTYGDYKTYGLLSANTVAWEVVLMADDLLGIDKTVSFHEKSKGWVSFKSFKPENAISMASDYYTFKLGTPYKHYNENGDRNTFYGEFTSSSIDVLLNQNPGEVKVFNTLNYEGSQSEVDKFTFINKNDVDYLETPFQPNTNYSDQEYYNLYSKNGWSVQSIITNKEEGYVNEFLEKEGKWFNGINKIVDATSDADTYDFTFQGIGIAGEATLSDGKGMGNIFNKLRPKDD